MKAFPSTVYAIAEFSLFSYFVPPFISDGAENKKRLNSILNNMLVVRANIIMYIIYI